MSVVAFVIHQSKIVFLWHFLKKIEYILTRYLYNAGWFAGTLFTTHFFGKFTVSRSYVW